MIIRIRPETYVRNQEFLRILLAAPPDEQSRHLERKARELRRRQVLGCLDPINAQDLSEINTAVRQAQQRELRAR